MTDRRQTDVYMGGKKVGTLAETKDHLAAFEYCAEWIAAGFAVSPISLPLREGVFVAKKYDPFDGLFGVFADSLPDGWGRLLADRFLRKNHVDPVKVGPFTRLAIVGDRGMGALEYCPSEDMRPKISGLSLDELAEECKKIFAADQSQSLYLDDLFGMGGSSGGARPKVYYEIDGEEWIVKFPSSADRDNVGRQEYDLETSHRIPNLDYNTLMQLTIKITHNYEELVKMFRLMCFNVFAHNRDDHSKNFSFVYKDGRWQLSPAYDLTYSNSIGGEHATCVNGNGSDPGLVDILEVAKNAKMDEKKARKIAEEIREIVCTELGAYGV